MKTFHELQEGVYDPNIFKAIFMAGGPGSGKSYVAKRTTSGLGLKMVNSDDIYEKMLNDAGLDTTPEDIYSEEVELLESHKFEEIQYLFWRNSNLNFNNPFVLIKSLDEKPNEKWLRKIHE